MFKIPINLYSKPIQEQYEKILAESNINLKKHSFDFKNLKNNLEELQTLYNLRSK